MVVPHLPCRPAAAVCIEYVVWEQVCEILSQPERLLSLAEEYLGLRGQQVEFERDTVADLDAQIAKQEKVLTENVVEAVKAGQSASVIQSVTAQLTNELDALRRHRKMLESWREESARESQRMRTCGNSRRGRISVFLTCRLRSRRRCLICSTCE